MGLAEPREGPGCAQGGFAARGFPGPGAQLLPPEHPTWARYTGDSTCVLLSSDIVSFGENGFETFPKQINSDWILV